ncbi:hypothetical protein [Paractinoplanes atraurantiacus]|uniref:DUF4386 family protein n=1 Tax=Paractinoplanes atraurantiacus TaxID=1036182 RepID=A0A285JJ21_9ACTN|nr:hypothetical protein [Actinoplanes atraurantiacus]SNY59091.1 hypothetical protein SAMN05421748_12030 [Actinoplanes atraurantiacus]
MTSGSRSPVATLGTATALATVVVALVAAALGGTTPARSGPYCGNGCVVYPYTDVAAFSPRDYWWMYPQSVLVVLALVLVICVHQATRVVFSAIAAGFAVGATTVLLTDYVVQLTVLQPSLERGETAGLSLLSQYNPHGVFIALENVGYLLLGAALLTIAAAFTGPARLELGLRWVLMVGGGLTVAALPLFAVAYGADLEARYEVAAIGLTWLTLIVGGILLARWFRRPPALGA